MAKNLVYFAHGQESGPWGTKITALAEIAKKEGFEVESLDYSHTRDADERVKHLLELKPEAHEHLVLVGSSMGGYVSTVASSTLNPAGLFLMAPAFYIEGYTRQEPHPNANFISIVHGWHDDVVPIDHSVRFAKKYKCQLHILDSDHRLTSVLSVIEELFTIFLKRLRVGM